jgi:hypothetical protein
MSISGIKPGISAPVAREVRLPGINLMTLLIKVAGGRELVMVHLGARQSHSRAIGRSIPHRLNFESLSIVRRGSPGRMQLLTDRRSRQSNIFFGGEDP